MPAGVITTPQLLEALNNAKAPIILDARWILGMPGVNDDTAGAQRQAYLESHIPGALFVDLEADFTGDMLGKPLGAKGGRHPLPLRFQLRDIGQRLGLLEESSVVVYDQGDCMAASRIWWILTDAGISDVKVLEGGWSAWQAANGPTESGAGRTVTPSQWEPGMGLRTTVDADEVGYRIAAGKRVIDVRAKDRYDGVTEPIDPVAGHIPGAENIPAAQLLTDNKMLKPAEQIRALVGELSADDVLYCGSGITASNAAWILEASGYPALAIYPGSWSEWSRQKRPVEKTAVADSKTI